MPEKDTDRLETFSDAVMAILITITVLAFHVPQTADVATLMPLAPLFATYMVSFQLIGTYWNNHHHLLRVTKRISPGIMWSNLLLLFCLSFIPFATEWLGPNLGRIGPSIFFASVCLAAALSYTLLQYAIIWRSGTRSAVASALSDDRKGVVSLSLYAIGFALSFFFPWVSYACIIAVALLWFVPDKRLTSIRG